MKTLLKATLIAGACWAVCATVPPSGSMAAEPGEAIEPFNGRDTDGWRTKGDPDRSHWTVGTASLDPADPKQLDVAPDGMELINRQGQGVDLYSEAKFGDAVIELEVMVPEGSNSGIYVMGEYEVQVFDSFGAAELKPHDMGAIYGASVPAVNASRAPGEWQKFIIEFRAPRFDDAGNKLSPATFVKVTLNDQVIHEDVRVDAPTPSCLTGKESSAGPLMFQGDHGPVAYRNIKLTPLEAD